MRKEDKKKFIGIEIGGTKLQLVIGTGTGAIDRFVRFTIKPENGARGIQNQLIEGLEQLAGKGDVLGVGVGFGGPVDWQTGEIQLSHQIEGWDKFNLKQWLETLTKSPVAIDNDANVAALGEALHGEGQGKKTIFYMTVGSGIGGGLIVNGRIYHGKTPGEAEIGHIRLNKNGATLESECSGWAVNKKVRTLIENQPESVLAKLARQHTGPEAMLLEPALEQNDEGAKELVETIADDIAFALSHVVHLFHPEILIIGGGLSLLGEHLQKPVAQKLELYIMKAFLPPPPLKIASLNENVVPLGALELAKIAVSK